MANLSVDLLGLVNVEAEIAALAAMRSETDAAVELAELLEASDFYDPRRQLLFEGMRRALLGPDAIDTAAIVAECLRVADEWRSNVRISPQDVEALSGNVQRAALYGNTLKRLAWLRRAADLAFWTVERLQTRPDPAELYLEMQERWAAIAPQLGRSGWLYGWDSVAFVDNEVRKRMEQAAAGAALVFDWPWESWRRRIRPLEAGMLGLIAAPDGIGKSLYLEEIAEHWARRGIQTVLVHLEDNHAYKLNRRLARWSGVPLADIEDGRLTPAQLEAIRQAQRNIEPWAANLHYYHAPGETAREIVRELETRVREGVCQAVVIDYLDKIAPSRAQVKLFGENNWERQANDVETLKVFGERNGLPIMAATQGNKQMQGVGTKTRAAIQGSGQKSQKAQLVIILTRDLLEKPITDASGNVTHEAGEYSPVVAVRIDKQNRGKTGEMKQVLNGAAFRIADIAREVSAT